MQRQAHEETRLEHAASGSVAYHDEEELQKKNTGPRHALEMVETLTLALRAEAPLCGTFCERQGRRQHQGAAKNSPTHKL